MFTSVRFLRLTTLFALTSFIMDGVRSNEGYYSTTNDNNNNDASHRSFDINGRTQHIL